VSAVGAVGDSPARIRRYNRSSVKPDLPRSEDRAQKRPPELASYAEVKAIAVAEMLTITSVESAIGRRAVARLFEIPAAALARSLVDLDHAVARGSLRDAALRCLRRYGVEARFDPGPEAGLPIPLASLDAARSIPVPQTGPVVIVSNHPGLFDALALFAAIHRVDGKDGKDGKDLAILAARRPLFDALPNLRRQLLAIDTSVATAMSLRQALRHLRAGGALLHFPAGQIEPDPRVTPAGKPLLGPWKPGLDSILMAVARVRPDLRVIPAVISGVISRRALGLARLVSGRGGLTDALVPLLQTTLPGFHDIDVRVRFGAAVKVSSDSLSRLRGEVESLALAAQVSSFRTVEKRASSPTFTTRPQ
jgi:hypothetical protein